jgi:hypothetical protein
LPVSSAAGKTKKSALLHATKKTSPLSLFTQAELHNDKLLSVTSAEDWTTKTKNMTKGETDELTNRMAAFILSLEDVNAFVPDTLLPNPTELQRKLRNLITTSHSIAIMKDFVQPYTVAHASGKNPAGFHGKGLNALVNLLDERVPLAAPTLRTGRLLQLCRSEPRVPMARPGHGYHSNAHGIPDHGEQIAKIVSRRHDPRH